ncbi:hypothetical protein [Ectobacillus panaciterrae]|uniref:hypothetical protein n=1 Tax=Ectobacillus panaciterrae TaxID=363872 RepID=UPI000422661D|nr:hypothetical protein [Ectobacillus panaciterrae]
MPWQTIADLRADLRFGSAVLIITTTSGNELILRTDNLLTQGELNKCVIPIMEEQRAMYA